MKKITEQQAEEKLRVIDIIKDNAALVLAIGGFCYMLFTTVIQPIKSLEYSVGDILNNHLKTIQDEQTEIKAERKMQSEEIGKISIQLAKLQQSLDDHNKK